MKEGEKCMVVFFIAILLAVAAGVIVISSAPTMKETYKEIYINGELPHHDDMTYFPHYVKIHIAPEKEGIKVTAIPEGQDVVLSGLTDSSSDVVFEMVSTLKYNLIVGFNFPPCQYYIIPRESKYLVRC